MIKALENFKNNFPKIKAIFMGTRRTDNAYTKSLKPFNKTTNNYPEFMLVNPILDWSVGDVWYFLLKNEVDYCDLYDKGFTSLGNQNKTVRNEVLKNEEGSYLPAFTVTDVNFERSNREK